MNSNLYGGLSPPPVLASGQSIQQQLADGYTSGIQWGIQIGTAVLGLMLIAGVIKMLISKL